MGTPIWAALTLEKLNDYRGEPVEGVLTWSANTVRSMFRW